MLWLNRYETEDIAEVVAVAFARGDEGYRASVGWKVHLRPRVALATRPARSDG